MVVDILFSAGAVSFCIALMPSIRGDDKPATKTSVLMAFWLTVYIGLDIALGLYIAAFTNAVNVALWIHLAAQVARRPDPDRAVTSCGRIFIVEPSGVVHVL